MYAIPTHLPTSFDDWSFQDKALTTVQGLALAGSVALTVLGILGLVSHYYSYAFSMNLTMKASIMHLSLGGMGTLCIPLILRKILLGNQYYYDSRARKFTHYKFPCSRALLSVKKKEGIWLLRVGKGASKKIKMELKKNGAVSNTVISIEKNSPINHELEIYEKLKDAQFIIHCLNSVETTEKKILTLELCENGTLEKSKQSLSLQEKITIFADCLRGLRELHGIGYLHLDLHADNLFITKDKRGRLGDFNSSRTMSAMNDKDAFDDFLPKNNYLRLPITFRLLAPEIFKNVALYKQEAALVEITGKADIWALGMTLAETLSPKSPAYLHICELQKKYTKTGFKFCPFVLEPHETIQYLDDLTKGYPQEPQIPLERLIWYMLHPNPEIRLTPEQAAIELENMPIVD
jgi:serine/threonine protein kinase